LDIAGASIGKQHLGELDLLLAGGAARVWTADRQGSTEEEQGGAQAPTY